MKKRIIVCCDGTWNQPEKLEHTQIVATNVLKMLRAVSPKDEKRGIAQVLYYHSGVGTGNLGVADKVFGGLLGAGISKNIQDCYRFIANNYSEGDELFLFGFSRGAYTVRSLSAMIHCVGILNKTDLRHVPHAYEYYHTEPENRSHATYEEMHTPPIETIKGKDVPIKYVGVWDTIGSLGIPTPILGRLQRKLGRKFPRFNVGFHNEEMLPTVENAFQALALDERRGPFKPSIWKYAREDQRVEQVWFSGVHRNIGGGALNSGLSDCALAWMIDRARECGLVFDHQYLENNIEADKFAEEENSYSQGYKVLEKFGVKPYQREIGYTEEGRRYLHAGEMIHPFVISRINKNENYAPPVLMGDGGVLEFADEGNREAVVINDLNVPVYIMRPIRLSTNVEATITTTTQLPVVGKLVNYSRTGACLEGAPQLAIGTTLQFTSKPTGKKRGEVVWLNNNKVGIKYAA